MNSRALVGSFLQHIEARPAPFSGGGEVALALVSLPLAFIHTILVSLYGKSPLPGEPWGYILLLALSTSFAFSTVLFLATNPGAAWIRSVLHTPAQRWLPLIPPAFVVSFLFLAYLFGFSELYSHALLKYHQSGFPLPFPIFFPFAIFFLWAGFRTGIRLAVAASARLSEPRLSVRHVGAVLVAVVPYLLLQELLPIVWCFTTPVALVVLVYASRIGREHFHFSFVPRSGKDALFVMGLLLSGLLLFLFVTLWMGTIRYTGGLWRAPWTELFDSLFIWLFVVGISEEVIFRCGLLVLLADRCVNRPYLTAVLTTSLLFGLAHLFRGATLLLLSTLASLLYGLAFVVGKTLFGPVLLHGILNVLVLMNFSFSDFH